MECNWPPLIDADLFQRVQEKLVENSEKRPKGKPDVQHVYLLEGALRCGACGAAMSRATGTGRNSLYH